MSKVLQHLLDEIEVARNDLESRDPEVADVAGHKPSYYVSKLDEVGQVLQDSVDGFRAAYDKEQEKVQAEDPAKRTARLVAERDAEANKTGAEVAPKAKAADHAPSSSSSASGGKDK